MTELIVPDYIKNGRNLILDANEFIVPTGACRLILQDGKTGKIKAIDDITNLVTSLAGYSIAAALTGDETNNRGIITYCAVGTSAVAPARADTQLTAELYRKAISVRSAALNVATFQTFFTTSEANGVLREAALFGDDATGVANSGRLFCKLAINRTKSSSDTLTLSWAVTIGS